MNLTRKHILIASTVATVLAVHVGVGAYILNKQSTRIEGTDSSSGFIQEFTADGTEYSLNYRSVERTGNTARALVGIVPPQPNEGVASAVITVEWDCTSESASSAQITAQAGYNNKEFKGTPIAHLGSLDPAVYPVGSPLQVLGGKACH